MSSPVVVCLEPPLLAEVVIGVLAAEGFAVKRVTTTQLAVAAATMLAGAVLVVEGTADGIGADTIVAIEGQAMRSATVRTADLTLTVPLDGLPGLVDLLRDLVAGRQVGGGLVDH